MRHKSVAENHCLAGEILRVDLSKGTTWSEPTAPYVEEALGGRGVNSLILTREVEPGTKWHDPENLLCFGAGSLVGTMAPGANRVDVSTINVFSGGKGSANVGGFWGPELKYAGFDHVIVQGKSDRPVYLWICDGRAELRDATFLWGKTVPETEKELRAHIGDPDIEIALIGPAGENRVRGSAVIIDQAKAAGGSGVGCVMGDKLLKAIVVRGHLPIQVSDRENFMKEVDKALKQCAAEPNTPLMRKSLTNFYADPDFEGWNKIMVVRNGQDEYWPREKKIELMNYKTGVPSYRKGMRACFNCPTGCMSFMEVDRGEYAGQQGEGFWVNTLMGHSCRMDISKPDKVVYSWLLNNDLGLDTDYVAAGLAWVFELYERGIITKEDTDGLELEFGDGDAFIAMMKKLAYREGIGDLLADGMVQAAEKFGNDALYYLAHMNGQPSIEPFRSPKGWGLAVATSPVAGRHMRGSSIGSNRFGPRPRPNTIPVNPTEYENQAKITFWQARSKELEDSLGVCNYVGTWSGANFETIENFANFVKYGLGLDVDPDDLMEHYAKVGRNLEKAFNSIMTDMKREDDLPPKRFRKEPVASGPHKGKKADEEGYNKMLDEFYEYWGWDKETGLQTDACLETLGMHDIAERLQKMGKLVKTQ